MLRLGERDTSVASGGPCTDVDVVSSDEKARGLGNEGQEQLGIMGNLGTGSFVYDRVGGMGSEREYILEVGDALVRREGTETGLRERYWSLFGKEC